MVKKFLGCEYSFWQNVRTWQTDRHRMTAKAALDASIARQKWIAIGRTFTSGFCSVSVTAVSGKTTFGRHLQQCDADVRRGNVWGFCLGWKCRAVEYTLNPTTVDSVFLYWHPSSISATLNSTTSLLYSIFILSVYCWCHATELSSRKSVNKKLSYRRETARCFVSVSS